MQLGAAVLLTTKSGVTGVSNCLQSQAISGKPRNWGQVIGVKF